MALVSGEGGLRFKSRQVKCDTELLTAAIAGVFFSKRAILLGRNDMETGSASSLHLK